VTIFDTLLIEHFTMDKQTETTVEFNLADAIVRDLLDTEIAFIGGGELVLLGG